MASKSPTAASWAFRDRDCATASQNSADWGRFGTHEITSSPARAEVPGERIRSESQSWGWFFGIPQFSPQSAGFLSRKDFYLGRQQSFSQFAAPSQLLAFTVLTGARCTGLALADAAHFANKNEGIMRCPENPGGRLSVIHGQIIAGRGPEPRPRLLGLKRWNGGCFSAPA